MSFLVDRASLLVEVPGMATLAATEAALVAEGLTLGIIDGALPETTVAEWLAAGAPGATSSLADPADHLVAGLTATLRDGRRFVIRPAPRRSVGPDLAALVVGVGGRFATIERAWLRVHVLSARRPELPLPAWDLDPPLAPDEAALLDRILTD